MVKHKLTERDSVLLVDLYKHRFLTIRQLQRMHFPSMQTAYRRVRTLREAGYVLDFTVPHIEAAIFTPAAKGLTAIAQALGVERTQLKWREGGAHPRDYYFMRHLLAINDFRIALTQACSGSDVKLLGFIPDYYGERTPGGDVKKYIRDAICDIATNRSTVSHTPDGVFALERYGKAALFFLEIDRGTEVVSDSDKGVLKSLRFYTSYLVEGKYQRYAKDFGVDAFKGFRCLCVTTTAIRMEHIRAAANALQAPDKAKRFLWIVPVPAISPTNLLTPIWRSIDANDETLYAMLGSQNNSTKSIHEA